MNVDRFRARDATRALRQVRAALGDDALVLHSVSAGDGVEITATTTHEVERFSDALRSAPISTRPGRRSRVLALVGPTGSGKTTTAAKLALSDVGFGGSRVGVISLDTYKIGAFDQIQTYADLAGFPLDLLSDGRDASRALDRLAHCDVILIDAPGRTPNASAADSAWRGALRALRPDEVHLVVSAGIRTPVGRAFRDHYRDLGVTHLLLTKLDEVPGEEGVGELVDAIGLPTRWVTDGQTVPDALHAGPDRIVEAALGGAATAWAPEAYA